MAEITLIPKDYKKEKVSLESVFSKAGILVVILIFLSLLVYGGLFFYNRSLSGQLSTLQGQIEEIDKQRDEKFEKEVVSLEKVLKNLKIILKNHFYWTNIFSALENLAVPQLSFSDFSGKVEVDGSVNLLLKGKTMGYTYLAKQMLSLSQEELVSKIELLGVTLGTEGGLEFSLNVIFLKDILLK